MTEAATQAAIVAYLRSIGLPDVGHVPNGGSRDKREAARLKWQGVLAGAPDLFVCLPDGRVAWLEVKSGNGRLSPEQAAFGKRRLSEGGLWACVRSIDDVRTVLGIWGVQTREAA